MAERAIEAEREAEKEASRFNRIIATEFTESTTQKLDLTRKISRRKKIMKKKGKDKKKKKTKRNRNYRPHFEGEKNGTKCRHDYFVEKRNEDQLPEPSEPEL